VDVQAIRYQAVDFSYFAPGKDHWRVLVNTFMNFLVP
jgi:hypothetical protein